MSRPSRPILRTALATLSAGLFGATVLAGCSSEVSTDDLEDQISTQLEEEVGTAPETVTCGEALDAEVDATARCTLEAPDGSEYGITATVSEVDGSDVRFDIEVDEEPMSEQSMS